MQYRAKQFSTKLNQCCDEIEVPNDIRERIIFLSKTLRISKQQARNLIEGQQLPDPALLEQIAKEFQVDPKWLLGELSSS